MTCQTIDDVCVSARALLGKGEDALDILHLRVGHALRGETHGAGTKVDGGCFVKHIGLVEGIHDILTYCKRTVFHPIRMSASVKVQP